MRSFILAYYGNTGSSWLIQMLGSAPNVHVPAFEPVEPWAWKVDEEARLRWIRNAFTPPPERSGAAFDAWVEGLAASPQFDKLLKTEFDTIGFKMTSDAFSDEEPFLDMCRELGTKLVFLHRNNRIKHALSLYRYHEEEKSQFHEGGVKPPSKVRLRTFDHWVERSAFMHDKHMGFRADAAGYLGGDQVMEVAYEDFVDSEGKKATLTTIGAFLDLDPDGFQGAIFEKATPDDLSTAVVNYGKLKRHYRKSDYARFFD